MLFLGTQGSTENSNECSRRSHSCSTSWNTAFRADPSVLRSGLCWRGHARSREVPWCCIQGTCWKSLWSLSEIHPRGCQRTVLWKVCPGDQTHSIAILPLGWGRVRGGPWEPLAAGYWRSLSAHLPHQHLLGINRKTRNVVYSAKSPSTYYLPGQLLC